MLVLRDAAGMITQAIVTAGQFCIVETIKRYGALYLALIMTLRQFVSISASSWLFGHTLSIPQW